MTKLQKLYNKIAFEKRVLICAFVSFFEIIRAEERFPRDKELDLEVKALMSLDKKMHGKYGFHIDTKEAKKLSETEEGRKWAYEELTNFWNEIRNKELSS